VKIELNDRGESMRFIHNMLRVKDLEQAENFWCQVMDFEIVKRSDYEENRFSLLFLKQKTSDFILELTYNWDNEIEYTVGNNFGHMAFYVEDIYELAKKLQSKGVEILRPPKDGYMMFIKSPNNISIEFLQEGERLEVKEPWASMKNQGTW
jgi:lactoylglutathione lyase